MSNINKLIPDIWYKEIYKATRKQKELYKIFNDKYTQQIYGQSIYNRFWFSGTSDPLGFGATKSKIKPPLKDIEI